MPATKKIVLCVDDDADVLEAMDMVLGSAGYRVVLAASGPEAMKTFTKVKPDMVIVDLMMESIDAGVRLVGQMRADGFPGPIVMLSSVGDAMNLQNDFTTLGLDGMLQKPIEPKMLLRLVNAKIGA